MRVPYSGPLPRAHAIGFGPASAQTTTPAPDAKAAPTAKKEQKPRSAKSLECSKQADAKRAARQGAAEVPQQVQEG